MSETIISKGIGIIPDFFHDLLAYVVPGYVMIILLFANYLALTGWDIKTFDVSFFLFSLSFIVTYIFGRFFEQVGKKTIHKKSFLINKNCEREVIRPKLDLLFKSDDYSKNFRDKLINKIGTWYDSDQGQKFMEESKKNNQDDYFNLIQYYLRARFPEVALYEKKQNANIVLSRSLSIIFFINIVLYFITFLILKFEYGMAFEWSISGAFYLLLLLILSIGFYSRFRTDQKYLAMYVFENFIGLKKLLKSKS